MKLVLSTDEIFPSRGQKSGELYIRVEGLDVSGRPAMGLIRGPVAERFQKNVDRLLGGGVAADDIIVEYTGAWKRIEFTKSDGDKVDHTVFDATNFGVLQGPALQHARLRMKLAREVVETQRAIEAGADPRAILDGLLSNVSRFAGVASPADLVALEDREPQTIVPEAGQEDQEAAAAARLGIAGVRQPLAPPPSIAGAALAQDDAADDAPSSEAKEDMAHDASLDASVDEDPGFSHDHDGEEDLPEEEPVADASDEPSAEVDADRVSESAPPAEPVAKPAPRAVGFRPRFGGRAA